MFSASNYHPVMPELRLAQGSEVREVREERTIIMEIEERGEEER